MKAYFQLENQFEGKTVSDFGKTSKSATTILFCFSAEGGFEMNIPIVSSFKFDTRPISDGRNDMSLKAFHSKEH